VCRAAPDSLRQFASCNLDQSSAAFVCRKFLAEENGDAMKIKPVVVDGKSSAYSADVENDDGAKIGEFDVTVTPEIKMPGGNTRPSRKIWTVKDANGKELGTGEF
jgi:hypothetical protein